MLLSIDGTNGGQVPCGVTAHGGPGGALRFDRLEAALAARFPRYTTRCSARPHLSRKRQSILV